MSALAKLQFVKTVDAEHDRAPHVRKRFVEGVEVQLQALAAEIENKPFTLTRERREKDEATGETTKFEKAVRHATWWEKGNNAYFVTPRYGSKKIQLSEGGAAIKTGDKLTDVKAVLELLIQAATQGELDAPLLKASERKHKTDDADKPAEKPVTPTTGKAERTTRGH